MEVSATAKYLPVSARKVRLVLDQLPGKRVDEAMVMLRFLPTPHAQLVAKVVKSAARTRRTTTRSTRRTCASSARTPARRAR